MPLPEPPSVMSYWRDEYADFYRAEWVMELARRLPEVHFRIAGASGKGLDAPDNVEFLGWQKDLNELYRQSTIYVRLVKHDGRCGGTLPEALARGRYVVYSQKHPHCRHVENVDNAHEALVEILQATQPNEPGARWVQKNFDPDEHVRRLIALYRTLW